MRAIQPVLSLIKHELEALNDAIRRHLQSDVELVNQISQYIIDSGGKRIRPIVHFLCAHAAGTFSEDTVTLATILEFIHSATLLHDDVVDGSELRRGNPTANRVWDNPTAVLVGDFLYSRSFQMMVSMKDMRCMDILADTTNRIAEGEVLQLAHRFELNLDQARYFDVIRLKTATLFEAAGRLGAEAHSPYERALGDYGLHLGLAFQLIDDCLDYSARDAAWGKQLGQDLAEGKLTLPLIYARQKVSAHQAEQMSRILREGDVREFDIIYDILKETGAFTYTVKCAEDEAMKAKTALSVLPKSPYRDALYLLAQFATERGS